MDDYAQKIKEQEARLQLQQSEKLRLIEQQQRKIREQQEQRQVQRVLSKPVETKNTMLMLDIEKQIEEEIKRKEKEQKEQEEAKVKEEKGKIELAVDKVKKENQCQINRYKRIMEHQSMRIQELQKLFLKVGHDLKQVSTTPNKNIRRAAISNANINYKKCEEIMNQIVKMEKGLV